jgi:pyrroloquinoline quinone biosynthesis protein D
MMAAIRKLIGNFTQADIDDEVIIMRLDNGELLSLSGSAAAVWRLIDGQRDRAALMEALSAEFAGHDAEMERDVGLLLRELMDADLVDEG